MVELTDRFHLGSMGKAITATVIARLVEEGKLAGELAHDGSEAGEFGVQGGGVHRRQWQRQ